jgi:hypothetical protein
MFSRAFLICRQQKNGCPTVMVGAAVGDTVFLRFFVSYVAAGSVSSSATSSSKA